MQATVQQLADEVAAERAKAWAKADPTPVAVAAGLLGQDDRDAIRRAAEQAGCPAGELDAVTEQVAQRLIGRLQAMDDSLPATAAD